MNKQIPDLMQKECWMLKAKEKLKIGSKLYGYCCGFFGRDSYGDKIIKEVNLNDEEDIIELVVLEDKYRNFCTLNDIDDVIALINSSNNSMHEDE